MKIGTPKEIKKGETRVAMTPNWTKRLTDAGHEVFIETTAGVNSGFTDEDYIENGAQILPSLESVYEKADFITKVKEIKPREYDLMRKDQIVMTWFHLAEDYDKPQTQALLDTHAIGVSMELIVLDDGSRPTMIPMSDIAGSLATLEAVKYCETYHGGTGLFLRKVYGLPVPKVVILGGGNAGFNAAQVAVGLGLNVTIIESSWAKIDYYKYALPNVDVVIFEENRVKELLEECDLFINCVYPSPEQGKRKALITREMIRNMKNCSLIMDIAGAGIVETSKYTTISEPTYTEEGILHYCVDNMPSLVPKTATEALLMITGPYILDIANKGLKKAASDCVPLKRSISTLNGKIVHSEIAFNQDMERDYKELDMNEITV